MRPIETQETRDKRKKRNQLAIGIVLIGLMVLSSAGYALINSFSGSDNQITNLEEKYGLVYDGSFWTGNVQGNQVSFTLDPDVAKNISVNLEGLAIARYSGQTVYVATNGDAFSFSQIATNLGYFTSGVREACFGECGLNLPEKTCNDTMILINTTYLENKVYKRDNCIVVDGNSDATEAMLYLLLGIIP